MARAVHVRPRAMNRRVDQEAGQIDRRPPMNDLPFRVHQHQVVRSHFAEQISERVHPEIFGGPRDSQADMPRDSIVQPPHREDPIRRRQLDLQFPRLGRVGQLDHAGNLLVHIGLCLMQDRFGSSIGHREAPEEADRGSRQWIGEHTTSIPVPLPPGKTAPESADGSSRSIRKSRSPIRGVSLPITV